MSIKYLQREMGYEGRKKYIIVSLEEANNITVDSFFQEKQKKDEQEALLEEKSIFLANVSHEIRTPMNGIIGMTELALQTPLDESQKEYLNIIKISADSLLHIINDILDFSKISSSKMSLENIPFSLDKIIDEVTLFFKPQIENKGLLFNVERHSYPETVMGDPLRMKQIFMNLLGNAIKFTQQGHITLSVRLERGHGDLLRLFSSVSDSGIGIAKEKQSELFLAFSQADSSTTRTYGGTGLGLAICSSLVSMMGGEIGVQSYEGNGSTFSFNIELKSIKSEIIEESKAFTATTTSEEKRVSWKEKTILVVEDNRVNRLLACRLLSKKGCTILEAENGQDALLTWEEHNPDLILMDMHMPILDGFEAFKQIRSKEMNLGKDQTPIIALTAMASGKDQKLIEETGFNDYVSKPFSPEEFYLKISLLLD